MFACVYCRRSTMACQILLYFSFRSAVISFLNVFTYQPLKFRNSANALSYSFLACCHSGISLTKSGVVPISFLSYLSKAFNALSAASKVFSSIVLDYLATWKSDILFILFCLYGTILAFRGHYVKLLFSLLHTSHLGRRHNTIY